MTAAAFDIQGLTALRNAQRAQTPEGVRQTAQQFEALFLQTMMKSMRATVPQDSFWHSDAEKVYTSLLDQQLATEMATQNGGLGFAKEIEKQLARQMGVEMDSEKGESSEIESAESTNIAFPELNIFSQPTSPTETAPAANVESAAPQNNNYTALAASPLFEIADLLYSVETKASAAISPADFEKKLPLTVENQNVDVLKVLESPTAAELSAEIAAELAKKYNAVSASQDFQNSQSNVQNFIENVWDDAQKVSAETGLNAAHIVAHAALESGWGKHQPGGVDNPSYNLFGIKADSAWQGKRVLSRTTEFENGAFVPKLQAFRAYDSYAEAFLDYADLMQNNPRYAQALTAQTAQEFAADLQKAGYATDPQYADKLQRTIEKTQQFLAA